MKKLKIGMAQMNPVAGDIRGNTQKILEWAAKAESEKADLIIFPEMALCGYPIWDLANHPDFFNTCAEAVQTIAVASKNWDIAIVFGGVHSASVQEKSSPVRPKVFNSLFWLEKGKVLLTYHKRLLPTYDVFLEDIFFESGKKPGIVKSRLGKFGVLICEDLWDETYDTKPLKELKKNKVNWVINISASPFFSGAKERRDELLKVQSKRYQLPIIYVNQTGAQDDLIFDGRSFIVDKSGKNIFQAPAFEEGLYFYDSGKRPVRPASRISSQAEIYTALVMGVRDYFRKNGFRRAVLGLSGGIDSALVAAIAVDALGADAVRGITMPSQYSSEGSWKDSMELAKNLGIQCRVYPIHEKFDFMLKAYYEQKKRYGDPIPQPGTINLAVENLQSRLRGLELMFISNDEGSLVLTTGNKSELAMGYCTLYGDMCGGLAVLGDVYKTEVYKLCEYRNRLNPVIPKAIIEKAPSAELRPNQKDQDSLPEYEILDEILKCYIEKNMSTEKMIQQFSKKKIDGKIILDTLRKIDLAEYKRRQTPPILRITEKAWFGRRMPITNQFKWSKD